MPLDQGTFSWTRRECRLERFRFLWPHLELKAMKLYFESGELSSDLRAYSQPETGWNS